MVNLSVAEFPTLYILPQPQRTNKNQRATMAQASTTTTTTKTTTTSTSSSTSSFLQDDVSGELILSIVSFLNVQDGNRFGSTCRRAYFWIHAYRRLVGPEFVAAVADTSLSSSSSSSSQNNTTNNTALIQQALQGLQAPPALCLSFGRQTRNATTLLPRALARTLPSSTVCCGVTAPSIQSSLPGRAPECDAPASLFLGTLPDTNSRALPFSWSPTSAAQDNDDDDDPDAGSCARWTTEQFLPQLQQLQSTTTTTSAAAAAATSDNANDTNSTLSFWKVCIVYATHGASAAVEQFLHAVQRAWPQLQIVGGLCRGGFVSKAHDNNNNTNFIWMSVADLMDFLRNLGGTLDNNNNNNPRGFAKADVIQQIHQQMASRPYYLCQMGENASTEFDCPEGIFGLVLGGHVPVQTVVSRGVQSKVTAGPPTVASDYVIHDAVYHLPSDEAYMFTNGQQQGRQADDGLPPYHLIRSIRHEPTGEVQTVASWMQRLGSADLVGLRNASRNEDGFCLHMPHPLSRNVGGLLLFQDCSLPTESLNQQYHYQIDLYDLDGAACRQDVHVTLQALQQEVANQKLLGACMFSCAARGPLANGMLGQGMFDATAWSTHFPTVPLLGWYAGGEIGPIAMAGRQHALRGRDATQRATLQGFTAVFALWIVPVVDWSNVHLDDAAETVQAFCRERLLLCGAEE